MTLSLKVGTHQNLTGWKLKTSDCLKLNLNSASTVLSPLWILLWLKVVHMWDIGYNPLWWSVWNPVGFMSVCLDFLVCEMEILVPTKRKGCAVESYCRGHPPAEVGAELPFPCDFFFVDVGVFSESLYLKCTCSLSQNMSRKHPKCFGASRSLQSCSSRCTVGASCQLLIHPQPDNLWSDHRWC